MKTLQERHALVRSAQTFVCSILLANMTTAHLQICWEPITLPKVCRDANPRHEEGRTKPPAPMLSFGAKPGTASILIPDHTHWGNEGPLLAKVSDGMGIQGWDRQHQYIKVTRNTHVGH